MMTRLRLENLPATAASLAGLLFLITAVTPPAGGAENPTPASALTPLLASTNDAYSMDLVRRGNQAFRESNRKKALEFFSMAIEANPTNTMALYNRGRLNDTEGRYTNALADYDRLLQINPKHPGATQLRGALHLRLGEFPAAIADYDHYIELAPKAKSRHWQRGLALYLAGRYGDAQRQFADCQKADTNDVDHALWHFVCTAKSEGVEKARAGILAVGRDRRPIRNDIYECFAGRLTPEQLQKNLAAIPPANPEAGDARFAVHYMLAQYYEVQGDRERARDYLVKASQMKALDGLSHDLAKVQLKLLKASTGEKPPPK